MSKISPHFSREEFKCKCQNNCGFNTVDTELIQVAELIRSKIGPFTPNSACRCPTYNKKIGGAPTSQHTQGKAIDKPTNKPNKLYLYLNELFPNKYGIGVYDNFLHIDVRDNRARWGNIK